MNKEIETSKALIKIEKEDAENIIKGLASLVEIYADSLKDLIYAPKIEGTILECELNAIEDTIDKLKSIDKTLNFFYERGRREHE